MPARAEQSAVVALQRQAAIANGAEERGHRAYNQTMHRSTRRLIALAAGLVLFLVASAALYQFGMSHLEGKHPSFWDSFEWAAASLSTTGYGADSHWHHPVMVMLVVLVEFIGVFLVFLIVPIFLVPFLEERFERSLPREAPAMLSNHVVVYRYGPAVETLLDRLKAANHPSLVVELDEVQARAALEREQPVVFSRSEEDALVACRLMHARALVANGRDEENAAITLRARHMGFRGEIFAFVEEPAHRKPMELSGATAAYTPRHIVAAALAAHVSDVLNPRLPGIDHVPSVHRRELRVDSTSSAAGRTLRELDLGGKTGAIVVGQWTRSQLHAKCDADTRVEPGARLELVGDDDALERAAELLGAKFLRHSGPFLIAGFGEVGRKVHELLRDAGEELRVIERHAGEGVDVVGNVLDPSMLERAGIREARAIVLALNSDDSTLFATVIARDAAPDVPVIARVNHASNVDNIYRAGADYALSISDISGEMLSSRLLGRAGRRHDEHRLVLRAPAKLTIGRTLAESGVVRKHGCSVLAVERGGEWVKPAPGLRVEAGDAMYLCGGSEAVRHAAERC
jgi:Trk K+ transport system NAD-binding subunit